MGSQIRRSSEHTIARDLPEITIDNVDFQEGTEGTGEYEKREKGKREKEKRERERGKGKEKREVERGKWKKRGSRRRNQKEGTLRSPKAAEKINIDHRFQLPLR